MKHRLYLSSLALLTLIAVCGAFAGEEEAAQIQPRIPKTVYSGEITQLSESTIQIRPWNPKLPRRLQVTATASTRYFKQDRADRGDLKPGDLVLIAEDPRPKIHIAPKKDETEEERAARVAQEKAMQDEAAKRPGSARAVVRYWPAPNGEVKPDDKGLAAILFQGTRGYFRGFNSGGANFPNRNVPEWIGVVKSVKPLVINAEGEDHEFKTYGETVWVSHSSIKPEDLKKDKTVLVHSATPPGADASIQALVIAVCPEPKRSPLQDRQLILRERKAEK